MLDFFKLKEFADKLSEVNVEGLAEDFKKLMKDIDERHLSVENDVKSLHEKFDNLAKKLEDKF